MSSQEIRIVKLSEMRVASVLDYGTQPEDQAWKKLTAWAKPKGLMDDLSVHLIFVFNNPSPPPASPPTASLSRNGLVVSISGSYPS